MRILTNDLAQVACNSLPLDTVAAMVDSRRMARSQR